MGARVIILAVYRIFRGAADHIAISQWPVYKYPPYPYVSGLCLGVTFATLLMTINHVAVGCEDFFMKGEKDNAE